MGREPIEDEPHLDGIFTKNVQKSRRFNNVRMKIGRAVEEMGITSGTKEPCIIC